MTINSTLRMASMLLLTTMIGRSLNAQITKAQDYLNYNSATIGTFQGIKFRESGFSGIYMVPNTDGKEFWIVSDRGVNVDCGNANSASCRPTYDKMYAFPSYAPKIHRVRLSGDSVQILQTITIKRPNGTGATGVLNPTGLGSTALEQASTDTVKDCANFAAKIAAKDIWGIDAEGIAVDKDGNFWLCEEGGPTIWKLNANGVVQKRYTPYAASGQSQDVKIDSVFAYRKNNRGFEGITIAPNGKIYAIIQSPILYPNTSTGESTRVHRILEIDPATNATRMLVYLNDGIIGASGANQIRLRDWKIGDMAAINDSTFLVLEAALRGTTDIKRVYKINISNATAVNSGFTYSGKTLEALTDSAGLAAEGIVPVKKTLYMDLFAKGWDAALDKAEGLAIVNDSTIVICNDNDYGQTCPNADGVAIATTNIGHVIAYNLKGTDKLKDLKQIKYTLMSGKTGPSTRQSPYLNPSIPSASFTSILTAGEMVNGYKMCGTPDGMGAFDNNDGTFTVVMNHEFGNTAGVTRAHGSAGAFVSKWVIKKSDLSVVSGSDLIKNVNLWNGTGYTTYNTANPSTLAAFGRFCSADLPAVSAFYNAATNRGTKERIFMNGEESGTEGRGMAHIVTGPNAGTSYELPYLGKFSWENSVASPVASDKTIVVGTDDATPGQVYVYIGTKTNTGTEIEKAGLSGGKLYGVAVSGLLTETSTVPAPNTSFSLADLGDVHNMTGAALNTASNNIGVTQFLRPEDGAWDPANPNDFYFATTNAINSPSRLWRLRFTDILNPELGGTATAVVDGTEGQKMLDNITIDNYGHVLMVEDVGGDARLGCVWQYTIATDEMKKVGEHDPTRFLTGGANFLTQDEEASGIIDVQSILGPGMFLTVDQTHYSVPGEVVEGGQLLAFYNPDSYNSNPEINITGNNISIAKGDATPSAADNTDFGKVAGLQTKSFTIQNAGPGILTVSAVNFAGTNASDFTLVSPALPFNISAGTTKAITVKFAPAILGSRTATLNVISNDFDEATYEFALQGTGVAPGQTGPSSSQSPYILPTIQGATFTSLLSAGDAVGNYKMCGTPDGLGAFDNGNGTFTLLMNHEFGNTAGIVRAHGSTGAFVSKWVINKSDLSVVNGSDLIKNVNLWNGTGYTTYNSGNPSTLASFGRFCSADLPAPSAFFNAASGKGTQERIFMNGEESGAEGRGMAHIVTGPNAGTSYELPYLGKFSWENAVANPVASDKTIVIGTDDATPGQVYVYIGTKTNTGTEIDKAGLTGGKLYGVTVSGMLTETNGSIPSAGTAFSLTDLGDVHNMTGAALQTASNNAGVTQFLRPEDAAWDPANPADLYIATTNAINSPSRLWRLRFNDISNPEAGGTVAAVLDGTEGQKMLDNITVDAYGHVILVEDVGGDARLGRVWQYNIATDEMKTVGEHDQSRFLNGSANFLTQDEEASGILDVQNILGAGMFLAVDQAHYAIAGELVEGGQLLAFYNPEVANSIPDFKLSGNNVNISNGDMSPVSADNTDFGAVNNTASLNKTFVIRNNGIGKLMIKNINTTGANASEFTLVGAPVFPATVEPGATLDITVKFAPLALGSRKAVLNFSSNDLEEAAYSVALQGTSVAAEINVKGNSLTIADGDLSPSFIDNTNFGEIPKGTTTLKTFEIQNTGTADLTVSSIAVSGMHATEFVHTSKPTFPMVIGAGTSQSIIIQFAPAAEGTRIATLTINSNDADEASYEFGLQGSGSHNTGISSVNTEFGNVKFYPNPVDAAANLEFVLEQDEEVEISVLDIQGKEAMPSVIRHMEQGTQLVSLNTASLSNGIYLVRIKSGNHSSRVKISVVH